MYMPEGYRIKMTKVAAKQLEKLPLKEARRIDRKILSLGDDPFQEGGGKLTDMKDLWRVRVGDYRIVYLVETKIRVVTIVRIRHRKEIYR